MNGKAHAQRTVCDPDSFAGNISNSEKVTEVTPESILLSRVVDVL